METMATPADGVDRVVVAAGDSRQLSIPDGEILFIAKQQRWHVDEGQAQDGAEGEAVYTLCWLHESPASTAGEDRESRASSPFVLGTVTLDEAAVQALPADVLEKHRLDASPLLSSSSSPLHVVVSTGSGLGQALDMYRSVLEPLLSRVFGLTAVSASDKTPLSVSDSKTHTSRTFQLLVTSSAQSVTNFAHTLTQPSATPLPTTPTIVLLSGDGGVVDLLNGLAAPDSDGLQPPPSHVHARPRPIMAVLPLGTGNALFHSLHRPQYMSSPGVSPLVLGLRTLFRGRAAPLPSFEASFSPGAHVVSGSTSSEGEEPPAAAVAVDCLRGAIVASYGFHAQLVWESDTPAYRKHGDKRFGMAAQELLKAAHAYAADVRVAAADDSPHEPHPPRCVGHRFSYVLATMVSNLEKTFTISPASQPLDGQLRLVYFGAVGGAKTMEIMMAAYNNGAHVGMEWMREAADTADKTQPQSQREGVGYEAIDELIVNVHEIDPRWRKVCIDGTIVELPQDGWIKVRKAASPVLQVIVNA